MQTATNSSFKKFHNFKLNLRFCWVNSCNGHKVKVGTHPASDCHLLILEDCVCASILQGFLQHYNENAVLRDAIIVDPSKSGLVVAPISYGWSGRVERIEWIDWHVAPLHEVRIFACMPMAMSIKKDLLISSRVLFKKLAINQETLVVSQTRLATNVPASSLLTCRWVVAQHRLQNSFNSFHSFHWLISSKKLIWWEVTNTK